MATPKGQKVIIINNDAAAETFINNNLAIGYVLFFIVNLAPVSNRLMIVYAEPADVPTP